MNLIKRLTAVALLAGAAFACQPDEANAQQYGAVYDYVFGGDYGVAAAGAYVELQGDKPILGQGAAHSLAELAVQSSDGRQIVEIGWTVDPGVNGDAQPRLFVYHWVNGQITCYNGCGFVSTSTTKPGAIVPVDVSRGYAIMHHEGAWWLWYHNSWIGYFPDSLWGGAFTQAQFVQVFGETADPTGRRCSDMGDGKWGTDPSATRISGYRLIGSSTAGRFDYVAESTPSAYRKGNQTATGFTFGGPGLC